MPTETDSQQPGYVPADKEPRITVNGVELTPAQSMTVRVGLSTVDFDCGDDDFGKRLQAQYLKRVQEVLNLMIPPAVSVGEQEKDK